ncbi:sulfite exporter TauE/SafE family protein, partial [Chloroflexota bacterium]
MTIPIVPGVEINLLLLGAVGLVLGVISGFTGVGGGFMMTPALIILGFPAHLA